MSVNTKKKTRKLAKESKNGRKYIIQERNETAKILFEIRSDMTRIKHNYLNKAKHFNVCGKSETTMHLFQCEGNYDAITEEMYVKITENIDEENPEIIRDRTDKFIPVIKTRYIIKMAKQDERKLISRGTFLNK